MPTGEVRDRFDDLTAALSEVIRLQVPMPVGVEGPEVRAAYRGFARVFHPWAIEAIVTPDDEPLSLPSILAKQTFGPIARMEQAFADPKGFKLNRDGSALVHRYYNAKTRKVDPIEVVLAPIESSQWFPTSTVEELQRKLRVIGAPLSFTFAVTIALAVTNQRVDLNLDEFIKFLGLAPRSTLQRLEQRRILWEC